MRHFKILISFMLFTICTDAYSIDRRSEIAEYVSQYQGNDLLKQKKITEALAWKGITDERVYDEIERLLLDSYNTHDNDRLKSDSVSWFIKALGFSGNPKYIPTLLKIKQEGVNRIHQKYIDESLSLLPEYTQWNKIINDESRWNAQESDVVNRYANMIQSDSMRLKKIAAKRIYNEQISSKYLLDIVEKILLTHYSEPHGSYDFDFSNTYGYMSKALSVNATEQYISTIKLVRKGGGNKHLRKLAQRHLSELKMSHAPTNKETSTSKEVADLSEKTPAPAKSAQTQEIASANSMDNINLTNPGSFIDTPVTPKEKSQISRQSTDLTKRLQTLKELYEQGLIDKEDFEEKKRSIISEL